jgi:hypothetical protein
LALKILFIIILAILYIGALFRLQGDPKERIIILALRIFTFLVISVFLFFPRIEHVKRLWKEPIFLALIDDSSSVILSKKTYSRPSWLEDLKKEYKVHEKRFSESTLTSPYSISSQLKHACEDNTYKAIFLFSDGQDQNYSYHQCDKPLFSSALGQKASEFSLNLSHVPDNLQQGDSYRFKALIQNNLEGISTGSIKVFEDGKPSKSIPVQLKKSKQHFEFDYEFKSTGRKKIKISFETEAKDYSTQNNFEEFFVNVSKEAKQILLVADYPNLECAFWLRALKGLNSVKVQEVYHSSKLKSQFSATQKPNLVILYKQDFSQAEQFLSLHQLRDTPAIVIFGNEKDISDSWIKSNKLPNFGRLKNLNKEVHWRLDSSQFPAFDLFSHSSQKQALLSIFPHPQQLISELKLTDGFTTPLYIDTASETIPIITFQKAKKPLRVIVNSSDLHKISFRPIGDMALNSLLQKMFQNLCLWSLNFQKLDGLEMLSSATRLNLGQTFKLNATSHKPIQWELKDKKGVVSSGSTPVSYSKKLPSGNYELSFKLNGKTLYNKYFYVGLDSKEFNGHGPDVEKLSRISTQSKGKLINNPKKYQEFLPQNLLSKSLVLKKGIIELQGNSLLLLLLLLSICSEWILRYRWRLV